jgi:hypothetical protein
VKETGDHAGLEEAGGGGRPLVGAMEEGRAAVGGATEKGRAAVGSSGV